MAPRDPLPPWSQHLPGVAFQPGSGRTLVPPNVRTSGPCVQAGARLVSVLWFSCGCCRPRGPGRPTLGEVSPRQGSHLDPVPGQSHDANFGHMHSQLLHGSFGKGSFVFSGELSSMATSHWGHGAGSFQSRFAWLPENPNLRATCSARVLATACRPSSPGSPGTADRWRTRGGEQGQGRARKTTTKGGLLSK